MKTIEELAREVAEAMPIGYCLLGLPMEDVEMLIHSLTAAEAMFRVTKSDSTPSGLTVRKIEALREMLIKAAESPDATMTRLVPSPPRFSPGVN